MKPATVNRNTCAAVTVLVAALASQLLVATPGFATGSCPPTKISLRDALQLALEASPEITAAQSRLVAVKADGRQSRAGFLPRVELAPGVGRTNGNAVLQQRLDIQGRLAALRRNARAQSEIAEADAAQVRLDLLTRVRRAYYGAVRARQLERYALLDLDSAQELASLTKRQLQLGTATRVELARAEVEVSRVRQSVHRATGERQARLARLRLLLGLASDESLELTDGLRIPEEPNLNEALQHAVHNHPAAVMAQGRLRAARGRLALARAEARPALFADLVTDFWSLDRNPFQFRDLGFQLRVDLPLFDQRRRRAGIRSARARLDEGRANVDLAERELRSEVTAAVAKLVAARRIATEYGTAIVTRSEEVLRSTRQGYEIGVTSYLGVLEAQRLVSQVRAEYVNALYDAVEAQIELDRATGGDQLARTAPESGEGKL